MALSFMTPQAPGHGDSAAPERTVDIRFGVVLGGAGLIGVGLIFTWWGMPASQAFLASAVLAAQIVMGCLLALLMVRRPLTVLELLGLGIALGTAAAVVMGLLAGPLGPGFRVWGWAGILALAAVIRLWGRIDGHSGVPGGGVVWDRPSALVGGALAMVGGLGAVALNMARYPLEGPWERYHPDMPFFEALGVAAVQFGPGVDPFMSGDDIRYHWFAYLWSGQLTVGLGLEPFAALTRVAPLITVVGLAALAAGFTGRWNVRWWAPIVAAVLVVTGGFVGAAYGVILNVDSPSTSITGLWVMAFVVLAFLSRMTWWGALTVGALAGFVIAGAKVSAVAALLCAWLALVVFGRIWKAPWTTVALMQLLGLAFGAAVAFFGFVIGSSSSGELRIFTLDFRASSVQGLDVAGTWWGIALGTLLLCAAVLPRAMGVLGLPGRSPEVALSVGLIAASILPILVLSQGVNELWFAVSAAAPLAVLSAVGLSRLWDRAEPRSSSRFWITTAAIVGTGAAICAALVWPSGASDVVSARFLGPLAAWIFGLLVGALALVRASRSTALAVFCTSLVVAAMFGRVITVGGDVGLESTTGRNTLVAPIASEAAATKSASSPTLGPAPAVAESGTGSSLAVAWSTAHDQAARWLAGAVGAQEVVATNEISSSMLPAVARVRTYLSGLPYQELYGSRERAMDIPERAMISMQLGGVLSEESAQSLCAQEVRWLWIEGSANPLDLPIAFQNAAVDIYRLSDATCQAW